MGEYRDRMRRDLEIRGLAARTCDAYVRAMAGLVRHYMRSPVDLGPDEINWYQHHLIHERKVSYSTFNIAVCAFHFFYTHTVPVEWSVDRVPYRRKPKRLPVILSRDEVVRILVVVGPLKHRVILMTIYGAGLRLREALGLRVTDIDSGRMTLRVRCGKGAKDRYVPLSPVLLRTLRAYWRAERPAEVLFPGNKPGRSLHPRTVQKILEKAAARADIRKEVSIHSLRHAFATHLLEDGAHIRAVQAILGHAKLSTTAVYLHCTEGYLRGLRTPADGLPLDRIFPDDGIASS